MSTNQAELCDILDKHQFDQNKLKHYLADKLPDIDDNLSILQFQGGQSNPTFLLETTSNKYVLRKKPPGKLLPMAHLIEREYRIIKALELTEVPVPKTYLLCEDNNIIGTSFYIMDYVPGLLYGHPAIKHASAPERTAIYSSMCKTMSALHNADWRELGLDDFGKQEHFYSRQIKLWSKQYLSSCDVPAGGDEGAHAMQQLIAWLPNNIPEDSRCCITHGDFRIGNMLIDAKSAEVATLLDWELSTLGHPLSDLAYCCIPYYLPSNIDGVKGLVGLDLVKEGIPSEQEFIKQYCQLTGRTEIENWPFYIAFSMFRLASILQGVYARALQGNASSSNALEVGARCAVLAITAWKLINKDDHSK